MTNQIKNIIIKHDSKIIFTISLVIFSFLIYVVNTDINRHIEAIPEINSINGAYPPNFLFYFIVNLFSGFSNNETLMLIQTIFLLSFTNLAKYTIIKRIIRKSSNSIYFSTFKINTLTLGLFFCFAIPDPFSYIMLKQMYLGKFVPMVWHNSTTIFLFPFAIALFWHQLKTFDLKRKTPYEELIILSILVIINIIIKPSFIFVYLPITSFFLLQRRKTDTLKELILNFTPIITGGLFILIQYYFIYIKQMGSFQEETSSVVLTSPFKVLTLWIPNWFIPISLLLSFAYPIYVMLTFKDIFRYKPFIYSLILTIYGIILSAFFMESGPRMVHGNFMWQNVICTFLLFLSTTVFIIPKALNKDIPTTKMKILGLLFIAHVTSGLLYLLNIVLTSSYH